MNSKRKFQILCATMNQKDFSKIEEMNIHSDVIFANQSEKTSYEEIIFDNHTAKMITSNTSGVGKNRNIALMYADAEICLLADDDIVYYDELEKKIISEFNSYPDADVIIFHLDTDVKERTLIKYSRTRAVTRFDRKPWGAVRIAFRLESVRKANVWFSTLFGGGAKYPCGEDSIWIEETYSRGLKYYVSKETIGFVSCKESTWYTGFDEKRFFAAGALYAALYPKMTWFWKIYFALRTHGKGRLKFMQKIRWIQKGVVGYKNNFCFNEVIKGN